MNLTVDKLFAGYEGNLAVKDVSFQAEPGKIIALIGPNGAGKSTLIKSVSGVLPAIQGKVVLGDQNIHQLDETQRAKLISVVPQAKPIGGAFSVYQTVMLGRTAYMNWLGQPSDEDKEITEWALDITAIEELRNRKVAELSGGEQQRVLLARALAQKTPILLMDEPTNHLDLNHKITFLNLLKKMTIELEISVLIAVHDLNIAFWLADEVILLNSGEVIAKGSPKDVITQENIMAIYQIPIRVESLAGEDKKFVVPEFYFKE